MKLAFVTSINFFVIINVFYISVECVIKRWKFFAVMKIILAVICLRRRVDCTSSGWYFVRVKHPSFATKGLMTFLLSWYYQKFHLGAVKHIKRMA